MLEIACFNAASAVAAARAGADRIELCADYAVGGTTPSLSTLQQVRAGLRRLAEEEQREKEGESNRHISRNSGGFRRERVNIPINVMIRPRAGDFTYSAPEYSQMKSDIETLKTSRMADGFVFGVLTAANEVDEARNKELVQLAAPLPCTFHRAIDQVADMAAAVATLVECGFKSVLTSGGAPSAREGVERVASLQGVYAGRISLILGGGVRSGNVVGLKRGTGVEWVHSAAITGDGEDLDEEEVRGIQRLLRDA